MIREHEDLNGKKRDVRIGLDTTLPMLRKGNSKHMALWSWEKL